MSGGNNILSLLGLALRGGRLAVGEEPTVLAAKSAQARLILLASDAADNTLRRAEHLAQEGHCLWLILPFSKAELGGALGRGSAAVAALTDTGLAAAVTERLALLSPERYGEIAERMELKRRRAKERQSAARRDPPPRKASPPKPHREGVLEGRKRPASSKDGRRPKGREPGGPWREHPRDGERHSAGKDQPRHGKPQGGSTQAGKRPYAGRSAGGRPQEGKGRPPQKRGRTGPDRPPQNRGKTGSGPRSAGGRGRGGGR